MSSELEVRPVSTAAEHAAFLELPYRIQGGDPHWVPPLRMERREHLDPRRNPWFEHAEAAFWLAWRDGRPVGRVSAQLDRLRLERHQDATGQFGMLEAERDPAVIPALLSMAEEWVRARGLTRISGPFSLSINDECGLLVEGVDTPPAMMMGHAPAHYAAAIERFGYAKAKDLVTYELPITPELPRAVARLLERSTLPGPVSVRSMRSNRLLDEVRVLVQVFNDAWSENWGFVPFTEAEIRHLAHSLRPLIRPELVWIAEMANEPVGVFLAVPDLNAAIADLGGRLLPFNWARLLWRLKTGRVHRFRVPLVGVAKRFQGSFAGGEIIYRLYREIHGALLKTGFTGGEVGWILEDNVPMRRIVELGGGHLRKVYRIYEKALA